MSTPPSTLPYVTVDAFTSVKFGGNPAAVVIFPKEDTASALETRKKQEKPANHEVKWTFGCMPARTALAGKLGFPPDAFLANVAREMNLSETAFVKQRPPPRRKPPATDVSDVASLPGADVDDDASEDADADEENDDGDEGLDPDKPRKRDAPPVLDFDLRWFTPTGREVDLCGHATLATAHALYRPRPGARERRAQIPHPRRRRSATPSATGCSSSSSRRTLPPLSLIGGRDVTPDRQRRRGGGAARARGDERRHRRRLSRLSCLDVEAKTKVLGRNALGDLFAVLPDAAALLGAVADSAKVAALGGRGLCASAPGGVAAREGGAPCDFTSRFWGPNIGIEEDPVTGSSFCGLAPYWKAAQAQGRGGDDRAPGERAGGGGPCGRRVSTRRRTRREGRGEGARAGKGDERVQGGDPDRRVPARGGAGEVGRRRRLYERDAPLEGLTARPLVSSPRARLVSSSLLLLLRLVVSAASGSLLLLLRPRHDLVGDFLLPPLLPAVVHHAQHAPPHDEEGDDVGEHQNRAQLTELHRRPDDVHRLGLGRGGGEGGVGGDDRRRRRGAVGIRRRGRRRLGLALHLDAGLLEGILPDVADGLTGAAGEDPLDGLARERGGRGRERRDRGRGGERERGATRRRRAPNVAVVAGSVVALGRPTKARWTRRRRRASERERGAGERGRARRRARDGGDRGGAWACVRARTCAEGGETAIAEGIYLCAGGHQVVKNGWRARFTSAGRARAKCEKIAIFLSLALALLRNASSPSWDAPTGGERGAMARPPASSRPEPSSEDDGHSYDSDENTAPSRRSLSAPRGANAG